MFLSLFPFRLVPFLALLCVTLYACGARQGKGKKGDSDGSQSEKIEKKPVLDVGTRLLYLVKISDKVRFNLEAEVTMMSPEFRFSFYMNNMDFTFGAVHVSRDAIEKASEIRLLFEDGLTELTGATALRISNKAYEAIVTQRKAQLKVQDSESEWFYLVENEDCSLELNGEPFLAACMLLRNESETTELKICRNVSHPVVLHARLRDGTLLELLQWHNPPGHHDKENNNVFL